MKNNYISSLYIKKQAVVKIMPKILFSNIPLKFQDKMNLGMIFLSWL